MYGLNNPLLKIMHIWIELSELYQNVFLLYFYYRTLFIFLPISHQLGPMLLRMKLMLQKDFMTYLRLFIIFMTASGIALNSIIYPFHPINYELFKKVFLFKLEALKYNKV